MRLHQRGRVTVLCRGQTVRASLRPLSGILSTRLYGEYVQDMLRLLLPPDALMQPGDRVDIAETPYLCVQTRPLTGHIQADLRRCAR